MTSKDKENLAGKVLNDTYKLLSMIGQGGMAMIYLALHLRMQKKVAIKIFPPSLVILEEALQRFKLEAKVTNDLGHPGIISVTDFNETDDGLLYIVMELLHGEDLEARLERTPLDLAEVVTIVNEVTLALGAAHAAGVIHRDIKPSNIFLCRGPAGNEFVKVLDFGISKMVGSAKSITQETGTVLGTPLYMPPELIRGGEAGIQSDVYSLGVVIYLMLTGHWPHNGESVDAVLANTLAGKPTPMSDHQPWITSELEEVVAQAMHKKPGTRFESMEGLRRTFAQAAESVERTSVAIRLPPDPSATMLGHGPQVLPAGMSAADTAPVVNRLNITQPISPRRVALLVVIGIGIVLLCGLAVLLALSTPFSIWTDKAVSTKTTKVVEAGLVTQVGTTQDAGSDRQRLVAIEVPKMVQPDIAVALATDVKTKVDSKPGSKPRPQKRPAKQIKVRRPIKKVARPKPPPKTFGNLRVATMKGNDPFGGAKVYLITRNGKKYLGLTPLHQKRIRVGTYQVEVKHGSVTKRRKVVIGAKTRIIVDF